MVGQTPANPGEALEADASAALLARVEALVSSPERLDLGLLELLLHDVGDHAKHLHPVGREVLREQLRRVLEGKVSSPARMLDAAIGRQAEQVGGADAGLLLDAPEPWPEPVNGAELLDSLERLLLRYLVLPDGAAEAMALWVLHAHAHEASTVSPLLIIASPVKRCGKTTVLNLLVPLVPRALPSSNITPSAIFRSIEAFHPTLLVDEADSFVGLKEELRGIINSGHTKATAFVIRSVGKDHEPRQFSTWAAKVVALIGRLPSTIEDRGIRIVMRRKAPDEVVERLRQDRLEDAVELCQRACRWAGDHLDVLRHADPAAPGGLHDREADNWRPLLAIADAAGGRWPEKARRAAALLSNTEPTDDSSTGIQLLADLRQDLSRRRGDRVATEEVLRGLCSDENRPWGEWGNGKPLTGVALARLLRPFDIRSRKIRIGKKTRQGYLIAEFDDAFRRYLPPEPEHPEQLKDGGDLPSSSTRNTAAAVPGRETPETPATTGNVPGVPAQPATSSSEECPPSSDREVFEL